MTREEDLLRIAKKLDKMVSRNNMDGALDLLRELKNFNMTLKLLQDTRIGMSVNGIRKHCTDEDVVNLAKILIKNWKKLLESAQNQKSEKTNENGSHPSKPSGSPNRTSPERDSRKDAPVDFFPPASIIYHHPLRRSSVDVKKERKDTLGSLQSLPLQSHPPKRPFIDGKKERKDFTDSKKLHPRKLSIEGRRESKDSTDSKSSHHLLKRQSSETKLERRDSTSSRYGNSPQAKKYRECKSKPETPKTPTTPTSPLSPSLSSSVGPLSPRLQTGDSIRDKCIEMLTAALRTDDDFKDYGANCEGMAAEIEDHIYQEIKATDMKYKNRVRSRISNLKDPKNPNLRKNVLAGAIELSRIATMTAEEMASDELKQLRNVLTQEAIREHQMAKTGGTTTDLLQCGKCRKKNCTYNQVQTRSADEPMTTFVLCNECGNRWKFC
ncbi:transcription elongation factor A protein 3 isoform X35 [Ctenopharyngodon idella]|uniref:transcription elongation factor A protein 3 isoform X35 n=1 Tax=Ctenopharyngodon idella TaxID=7959 RepID=UPI0022306EDA|nr:transcription elongation factor A protein 3 isoform X35 [Ctenopharyngodon idella]